MTGLQSLREELKKRGLTTQQINSRGVMETLSILAETDAYTKEEEVLKELESVRDSLYIEKTVLEQIRHQIAIGENQRKRLETWLDSNLDAYYQEKREPGTIREALEYIDDFYKALNECETPEGRDCMKAAQVYVNSVKIDTKYDNTAFIAGLAAILSKGGISSLDSLKKINAKLRKA